MAKRDLLLLLGLMVVIVSQLVAVYSANMVASNIDTYLRKLWGLEVSYATYKPHVHPIAAIAGVTLWIPAVEFCIANVGDRFIEFHISKVSIYKGGERVAEGREPVTLRIEPGGLMCTKASMNRWSVKHFVDLDKKILPPGEYTLVVEGTLEINVGEGYRVEVYGLKLKAPLRIP